MFPQIEDSLPRMPTNDRAKFDAASFILGGKMHNRTNTRNYKKNKQTANDISKLCLSACVDNKQEEELKILSFGSRSGSRICSK